MPKLNSTGNLVTTVPLSQIVETGNVRTDYNEEKIKELANSILINGLINPLTVKKMETPDSNGNAQFELNCGHRRLRAYQYLCAQGHAFTSVPVRIVQGSKIRLQLIENIQRENLSHEETEKAIKDMIEEGMTQAQISSELSKSISWVHDVLAGTQVRSVAESKGIDTEGISTKALSQLAKIPEEQQAAAIEQTKADGGTVKAATKALNDYKNRNNNIKEAVKPVQPMNINIQTVIDMITDYMHRSEKQIQERGGSFAGDKECFLHVTCGDLIALFEAYQHA